MRYRVCLGIAVLVFSLGAASVTAVDVSLSSAATTVKPGDTFEINCNIVGAPAFANWGI